MSKPLTVKATWNAGWCSLAQPLPSPNFGPRPADAYIDLVVIHSISLPPGEFGNGNVARLFTNQLDFETHPYFQSIAGMQVSSHFFITRVGELWQFVSCDDRAWHAGVSSYRGRNNCNDDSIGIELEGSDDLPFESEQYQSLVNVVKTLRQAYPKIQNHIAGHSDIAPKRKTDPGLYFDWQLFRQLLSEKTSTDL